MGFGESVSRAPLGVYLEWGRCEMEDERLWEHTVLVDRDSLFYYLERTFSCDVTPSVVIEINDMFYKHTHTRDEGRSRDRERGGCKDEESAANVCHLS